ncbi:MAG: CoA-acylating methylmalonate-semialdehyde dehydrogenase [Steroidobacteraceae bacterium]
MARLAESLKSPQPVLGHRIAGQMIHDPKLRTAPVFNPAQGAIVRRVSLASKEIVATAVTAAARAYPDWRNTPPNKRAEIFVTYRRLLALRADAFAAAISEEHGKLLADAAGEFQRGLEIVDYACGIAELLQGDYSKNAGAGIDTWSEFQALGVVAGITPFNFPAMVPMWMYPIAIACGNTFVLKPSEKDPSASLMLAELFDEAALPAGVFNVVNGDSEAATALLEDPRVAAVSFVGSTPLAEQVYRSGTHAGKRIQALGGAKNHAVIMPDADIELVVSGIMGAAFGSCGERCMAISVAVCVGKETAERVASGLTKSIHSMRLGSGGQPGCDMGPLISRQHLDKVLDYVAAGVTAGATLLVDGREKRGDNPSGYFLGACLFDHVTPDMRIYQEEIFGPVLCVVRVESLQDAMHLVDAHAYGNGTCIYTRDGEAARYFSDHVQVGMVGINVPLPVPVANHSFGGWKRSLFGDLGVYGPDGVRFYTRRKTITQRWPRPKSSALPQFAFPSSK